MSRALMLFGVKVIAVIATAFTIAVFVTAIGYAIYSAGEESVRASTRVVLVDGRQCYGPYFGKCAIIKKDYSLLACAEDNTR